MIYVVIDTNVIVSSFLSRDSIPGFIVEMIGSKIIVPIISDSIFEEYKEVLKRDKFGFNISDINLFLQGIKKLGMNYKTNESKQNFIDVSDKKFYDLYYSHNLECETYLITGNKKHFPSEKNIVSPREFLEMLINK